MKSTRRFVFVASVIGMLSFTAVAADSEKNYFGVIAVTEERSTEVKTKDYGTLHCTRIAFRGARRSVVIIKGQSDLGFSGGMIYETEEKGFPQLLTPDSVWGGILHHEDPTIDDATIQVRTAVASFCHQALYKNTI